MKAVERKPVVQQVVESLTEYILSGEVQAGDKLPTEMELCERLSVGRGTVREAMRILQATGYVEMQAGRGAFAARTTKPDPEDLVRWFQENEVEIKDILEVRTAIEPLAVKLAIRRCTAEDITRLKRIHEETLVAVEKGDAPGIAKCDEKFHDFIMECSRNKLLTSINDQIEAFIRNFREKTFYIPSNAQNLIRPHGNILQAFVDKDAAKGEEYMKEHLAWVRKDLEKSAAAETEQENA